MFFPNPVMLSALTGSTSILAAASKAVPANIAPQPAITFNDPAPIQATPTAKIQYSNTALASTSNPTKPPVLIDMPESWFEAEEKINSAVPTKPPIMATVETPTTTIANFTIQKTEPYTAVNQNAGIVSPSNSFTTKAEPVKNADAASTVGTTKMTSASTATSSKPTASVSQGPVKKTTTPATTVANVTETAKAWPAWTKVVAIVAAIAVIWIASKYIKFK